MTLVWALAALAYFAIGCWIVRKTDRKLRERTESPRSVAAFVIAFWLPALLYILGCAFLGWLVQVEPGKEKSKAGRVTVQGSEGPS